MAAAVASTGQARPRTRSDAVKGHLLPWLWVGPAIFFVVIWLVYPVIYTIWLSLQNRDSTKFVGIKNYTTIFTNPGLLIVIRNNIIWLVLGTVVTVFFGLVIAVLVDRVRIEGMIKAAIFVPMAISFVGAGIIWNFVYQYTNAGQAQIGLLDAIIVGLGKQPQAWLINQATNNIALIVVYIWMWTGFCMVILSAALKSVPSDIIEAARVDGANEVSIFFRIIVPVIAPTIAVVATTMVINLMKIFDIIYVMTGGNYNTNVIALEFYQEEFSFSNIGLASAFAVLLLIAIIPIMLYNIRRFRAQEAMR